MEHFKKDYNFISGIFKSRERQFLNSVKIESLLSADSYELMVSQLTDNAFSQEVKKGKNIEYIEAGVQAESNEIVSMLIRYSPSYALTNLIFIPWDIFNLKVAILRQLTDKTPDESLYGPEGSLPIDELKRMAQSMAFESLPSDIYQALQKAWYAYYDCDKNTQAFEIALDRQKHVILLNIAENKSPRIFQHIKEMAYVKAAEVLIRGHMAGLSWSIIQYGIADLLDPEKLENMYNISTTEWGGVLSSLSPNRFKSMIQSYIDGRNIHTIVSEKEKEVFIELENWKYLSPSIEYAYYFLSKKQWDIHDYRLILIGKMNQISSDLLKKRMLQSEL